jgi:hypothetical protein
MDVEETRAIIPVVDLCDLPLTTREADQFTDLESTVAIVHCYMAILQAMLTSLSK